MVTLKFEVYERTENPGGAWTVKLRPVVSEPGNTAGENAEFYKWTPAGELVFSTINENAALLLKVGDPYYFRLDPAPRYGDQSQAS